MDADFILALGYDDRNISTMVRQMKMIHQNGYTHGERIGFRQSIWKSLLKTSRSVVQVLRALHADSEPATLVSEVRRC